MTLVARGLTAGWGTQPAALHDVHVQVARGEVLAVTGASGAGKTTLLAALAGLLPCSAGDVTFAGARLQGADAAVTLQGVGLVSVLTAAENVEVLLQARGVARAEVLERAARALVRVGLGDLGDRPVDELSGGQQQRVAVARALVLRAPVLLADEPTSELDSTTRDVVVRALREEARGGACVVVATHDPEITQRCDRRLHLVDGRVCDPPVGD